MRFWILLLTLLVTLTIYAEKEDVFEGVTFNPLGHFIEPKLNSSYETGIREYTRIDNEIEPLWGKVNFGNIDSYKVAVTDANGVDGVGIGEAEPVMDMLENSLVESKVPPAPKGLTVDGLPGVQGDDVLLNSFIFKLEKSGALMAPRNYYLQEESIRVKVTDLGLVSQDRDKAIDVTVMQVPFGEDFFLTDTTGLVTEAGDSAKATATIKASLKELEKVTGGSTDATITTLSNHLFTTDNNSTTSYENINSLINNGAYADAYQQGLVVGLGKGSLPGVHITSNTAKDVYAQFDVIYNRMANRAGEKYFPKPLVDWAQTNALSITNTLMVNYMIQGQFKGTQGNYTTPMTLGYWKSSDKDVNNFLIQNGRKTKEPYFLYTVIDPQALKVTNNKLDQVKDGDVQPHLSYIFNLYTAIHSQVWQGTDGINGISGISTAYNTATKKMERAIIASPNIGSGGPSFTKSFRLSEVENNNLVSGLSTYKGKERYKNHNLVSALRLLLSSGEMESTTKFMLNGEEYRLESISQTKFTKRYKYNHLYSKFKHKTGDMFSKWEAMILGSSDIPIHPVVFRSYWEGSDTSKGAYIMMPTLLGGKAFPGSVAIVLDTLAKPAGKSDEDKSFFNMSSANRYIMAFNLKHDMNSSTKNEKGIVRVKTGAPIGVAKDGNKPIIITGYIGGESFNIVDYFKAQESLSKGNIRPDLYAVKSDKGKVQLDYLNLFEDFFTIRNYKDFSGTTDNVTFNESINKDILIKKYVDNKTKAHVKMFSPNYENFFDESKPAEED